MSNYYFSPHENYEYQEGGGGGNMSPGSAPAVTMIIILSSSCFLLITKEFCFKIILQLNMYKSKMGKGR